MMDIRGLAYVVAESSDMPRWKNYAEAVLGMMTAPAPDGSLRVKMDERQFRIAVQPGARDAYVASGWEVAGARAFAQAVDTLKMQGVAHDLGHPALCAARGVQALVAFADPSGNRHDVVWGFQSDFLRFVTEAGRSSLGLGHVLLPTMAFDATLTFALEVMGLGPVGHLQLQAAGH